ncbi:hypothetical protein EFV37_00935 [Mesorhizobium loti]|uniref:Uncharacterized protein n=1 Tax=Mesorhizobium jarvisii TaxID=1777867 RepID=A0A6M7TBQ3_9HYPH|nr:hypothetical protein EB229_00935 [Mesorhizobium jarvisii]QKD06946.1 hypothetical protein EFV37_00935 [Mesorhizobium loti]RJT34551.1 hypothetical protein D3242_12090 [Mesorhizobium jarvisii]
MWEKVSPQATDEGCSRERQRLTPLEHPSSVLALRANPPSPTRGEGKADRFSPSRSCHISLLHEIESVP